MIFRKLGRTPFSVSVLGFGAATLGNEYGVLSDKQGEKALHLAIDQGINLVDTSPYYGRSLSEARLGKYLKGKRHQVVLATKTGRYDVDVFDYSAARIRRSLQESLRRLRTDYLDILQLHDIEFVPRTILEQEAIPQLLRLREEGHVRCIGITGYPLPYLTDLAAKYPIDIALTYCHYNLMNTRLTDRLLPLAKDTGIGVINASPLHMGILTPEGPPEWHMAPADILETGRRVVQYCQEVGYSLPRLALQFALSEPRISSTLVGMRSTSQVADNLTAIDTPLPDDLLAAVQEIIRPVKNRSWPMGLSENQ